MIKIAPSTNPEREEDLINYVKILEQTDADFLHCDVMDGNFVENKCLSAKKLYEVSQNSTIALDVHLMVSNPIQVWKEYYKSKPTIITVHYESFKNKTNLFYLLNEIKKKKIMAGISVKPNTSISEIEQFLPLCDLVLVMSVEPGLSGQKFIDGTLTKPYFGYNTWETIWTELGFYRHKTCPLSEFCASQKLRQASYEVIALSYHSPPIKYC